MKFTFRLIRSFFVDILIFHAIIGRHGINKRTTISIYVARSTKMFLSDNFLIVRFRFNEFELEQFLSRSSSSSEN